MVLVCDIKRGLAFSKGEAQMAYAICRTEKITAGNLNSAGQHNRREVDVPNADPDRGIRTYIGKGKSIPDLVHARIEKAGAKIRKNSVLAQELLLTASPEYFRPEDSSEYGAFDSTRLDDWLKQNRAFLTEKYGANLVAVDLHLDEATPHIHALVVPIVEKQQKLRGKDEYITVNKLSANDMFNPRTLRILQDEYAKAMKPLGLKRGVKGSKAKHEEVKKFYGQSHDPVIKPTPVPPIKFDELPSLAIRASDNKLRQWLDQVAQGIEDKLKIAVERMAAELGKVSKQAQAYERRWKAEKQRTATLLRDFGSLEGIRTVIEQKDAEIAAEKLLNEGLRAEVSDVTEKLDVAQAANEGLEKQVQVLKFEARIEQKGSEISL